MSTEQRTINGKPFTQALQELKAPFPYLILDLGNNEALEEEQVYERLDEVLGLNYSFVLTMQPKLETIDQHKHTISCAGFIEIRDDDGLFVARRTQAGGNDVTLRKGTIDPLDMSSDYKKAVTDCFKKVAKSFGVRAKLAEGGQVYKASESPSKKKNAKPEPATNQKKDNKKAGPEGSKPKDSKTEDPNAVNFKLLSKPSSDSKRMKFEVDDGKGNTGELVLWNNTKPKINPEIVQRLNSLEPGVTLMATIKEGEPYHDKRQFYVENILKIA